MYKELALFIHWIGVLVDPVKENHLAWLDEDCILCVLTETLVAHIEAMFPDQTVLFWADTARVRTLAEFSQVALVTLLVTQLAFRGARRQKAHEFL